MAHYISNCKSRYADCRGRPYQRVAVHYNIPDAETQFLFQPSKLTSCPASDPAANAVAAPESDTRRVGALSMHPICAWGILQDLQEVYENPDMRVSMAVDGVKGMKDGVMSVLARDIFSFGSAVGKTVPHSS